MRAMPKGRLKYVLAGLGVVYLVLFVGYLVYTGLDARGSRGPSELELHPERQAEIRARERAEQLQNRLKLSDEQTDQLEKIFLKSQPMGGPPPGGPGGGFQAVHDQIMGVLTPEQREALEEMRSQGPPGGPGGPGGGRPGGPPGMNPERLDAIKEAMTPEQKERFEKQLEKMKERMPFGPGGPGGPGGPRGSGGPGQPPPSF